LCITGTVGSAAHASSIDDYVISFETTDCDGRFGMGMIRITDIYRINPHRCPNGRQLAQLVTKGEDSNGPAGMFLMSPEEMKSIREEVKVWQAAKRQQMLNTDRIVID